MKNIDSWVVGPDTKLRTLEVLKQVTYTSQGFKKLGISDNYVVGILMRRGSMVFIRGEAKDKCFQVVTPSLKQKSAVKIVRGSLSGLGENPEIVKELFAAINELYPEVYVEPFFKERSAYRNLLESAGFSLVESRKKIVEVLGGFLEEPLPFNYRDVNKSNFSYSRAHLFSQKDMLKILMRRTET